MSTTADHSKPASVETVLVVDGDALVRMPLARYLRDCGYRVVEAPDADAALVILRKPDIQVDVVLCDVDLPGTTNGFELAIRARSVRPGLKVVLVGTPKRAVDVARPATYPADSSN